MSTNEQLIVALDVDSRATAERLVAELRQYCGTFKVGTQLFSRSGPEIVEWIRSQGAEVFLDLKFHDIPNTVAEGVRAAVALGVKMLTVHCAGGVEMMKSAAGAAQAEAKSRNTARPLIVGVTVLTSLTDDVLRKELGMNRSVREQVAEMAALAKGAGLDGVVASVDEIPLIRERGGQDFVVVTPGIRLAGADTQDQKRVATPETAIRLGANFIVVGRPICAAPDPAEAARAILQSFGY